MNDLCGEFTNVQFGIRSDFYHLHLVRTLFFIIKRFFLFILDKFLKFINKTAPICFAGFVLQDKWFQADFIQSNFSGSNTFGTMKISSRQG